MIEKKIDNNVQINIAKDNSTINSEYYSGSKYGVSNSNIGVVGDNAKVIYNMPKVFDPNKKIMQTNLAMLSENFTGREEYIKEMECLLIKQDVIVLSGNGGIGKTQIVLKYIKSNKDKYKYNNIAFINASSGDSITKEYSQFLNIENDDNTITNMKSWANVNQNWLFVYDNLDEEFLEKYNESSLYLNKALKIIEKILGFEHPTTKTMKNNLEILCKKMEGSNLT
jgi:hypothetical protein